MVTTAEIKEIIEGGTYAYFFRVFEGERAFTEYPSLVIMNPVISETESLETDTVEETIELNFYMRFNRQRKDELKLLEQIENEITAVIKASTVESGEFFFSRSTRWNRSPLEGPEEDGIHSTFTLGFREVTAGVTDGTIGAGATLLLGSTTTLKLIRGSTGSKGRSGSQAIQDDGENAPIGGAKSHTRTFEYAYTQSLYDAVDTMIHNKEFVTGTLRNGNGEIVTQFMSVLPLIQRESMDFEGLNVIVLEMEIASEQ